MHELKLSSWTIKTLTFDYTLWSSENKVMIEYKSEKIATISIDPSNIISINSVDSNCDIDKEKELITVVSTNDPNIRFTE